MESKCGSESRDSSPEPAGPTPPRPNVRTSCDLCKRMKIKCERQGETCTHCIDRSAKCETTIVERKKRVVKRVDPGSIVEMEERINRLEAVIVASGLEKQMRGETPDETAVTPPPVANVTDRMSMLFVDEEGSSTFVGSSSGFSLFSPQGLQWIAKKTGSTELPRLIKGVIKRISKDYKQKNPLHKSDFWSPKPRSSHEPLPPKEVADEYVKWFFDFFNCVWPLFDRDSFDHYYNLQYTGTPPAGTAWYASLNVVLAIGGVIFETQAFTGTRSASDGDSLGLGSLLNKYFRNAASCYLDLVFEDPSLLAVQAICGMAVLQQMNLEPHPSYVLAASAGRMAYTIGLHRKLDHLDEFAFTEADINQRRNVFWVAYTLDKGLALRLGHPSVMNDDDIGVDLPTEHKKFGSYEDGSQRYDIFKLQVQLALLESRSYTDLYSAAARKKSPLERLRAVGKIDKELQDWLETVPVEIRPDKFVRCAQDQFPPVFMLHFEFFNILSTIHRISIHHQGCWANDSTMNPENAPHSAQLNSRVFSSQSICLEAARSTIKLLRYVGVVDRFRNFVWTQMYFPLSAFLMLFANTLNNPEDPSTSSDLELMDLVISVFAPMTGHTGAFNAAASIQLFEQLRVVTKKFMETNSRDRSKKMKREYDSDLPKDGVPFVAVVPPATSVPQAQSFPPHLTSFADPSYIDSQSYAQPPPYTYTDGAFMPDAQTMAFDPPTSFPTLGFDPFVFNENFTYDLADLWTQEYSPYSPASQ